MINMIIGNLLLLLNLNLFSQELLEQKFKNKWIIPFSILLGVLILASRSYPSLQLYGTFIMLGYYSFFVLMLFNGKITNKIFIISFFVVVISISEILVSNLLNLLFGLLATDLNKPLYTFALLLSNGITYSLLVAIAKFFKLNTRIRLPKSTWIIFALPFSTFLLIISLKDYFETFRNNILVAPILIGLLIANFITIYIFFQTINTLELKSKINSMQVKYDTLNSLYQNNFNFLHDTIWKLNNIYKDVNAKRFDNLPNQVEDLSNNILRKFNVINTNSNIISSILNYRLEEIIINNIDVKTDFIFNDYSFLSIKSQTELFSTIINLAIDSCIDSGIEHANILLRSELINSNILFKCIYSTSSSYQEDKLHYCKEIVKQCNGKLLYKHIKPNIFEITVFFSNHN